MPNSNGITVGGIAINDQTDVMFLVKTINVCCTLLRQVKRSIDNLLERLCKDDDARNKELRFTLKQRAITALLAIIFTAPVAAVMGVYFDHHWLTDLYDRKIGEFVQSRADLQNYAAGLRAERAQYVKERGTIEALTQERNALSAKVSDLESAKSSQAGNAAKLRKSLKECKADLNSATNSIWFELAGSGLIRWNSGAGAVELLGSVIQYKGRYYMMTTQN